MKDLPLCFKINEHDCTLQLLSSIQVVNTLETCHYLFDDVEGNLNLPRLLVEIIKAEEEYQVELYFSKILEPSIDYTYPNEY